MACPQTVWNNPPGDNYVSRMPSFHLLPKPLCHRRRRRRRRRIVLGVLLVRVARNAPEGVEAGAVVEEVDDAAVLGLEGPLGGLEDAAGGGPVARETHDAAGAGALDGERDVDAPPQLVHLARDPRDLPPEVDLVAEVLARLARRPQGVQRRRHHGRRQLLVVEDGHARGGDRGREEGEGPPPPESVCVCRGWV